MVIEFIRKIFLTDKMNIKIILTNKKKMMKILKIYLINFCKYKEKSKKFNLKMLNKI